MAVQTLTLGHGSTGLADNVLKSTQDLTPISVPLRLSSVGFYHSTSGARSIRVVVYDMTTSSLIHSGPVTGIAANQAGAWVDLPVSPSLVLEADRTYRVGIATSGGSASGHEADAPSNLPHTHTVADVSVTMGLAYVSDSEDPAVLPNFARAANDEKVHRFALEVANQPPNAPILIAPADGSTIDRNSVQRFDWDFSDPDAGDSQSKYDLRYRIVGAGTWTDVTGTTPNTFHDFAAGTFAAGDYEWQVRTYDAQGVVGPYSASSFFTAATAPPAPTITDPVSGGTIASEDATVTWSAPDQDEYQVRTVADNAGVADTATVYQDTGAVASTTERSRAVAFPVNNRYEHVQVRIKDGGLWSSWASVRVLVSYTPPPTPVVSLLADDEAGSLVVTITNPAPGAGEPAVSYNNVYIDDGDGEERRATLVPPNSSWTFWTPKSGRDYAGSVRVTAVGDNGTSASS